MLAELLRTALEAVSEALCEAEDSGPDETYRYLDEALTSLEAASELLSLRARYEE